MNHNTLILIIEDHGVIYTLNDKGQAISIDEHNKDICLSDFSRSQLFDWLGY